LVSGFEWFPDLLRHVGRGSRIGVPRVGGGSRGWGRLTLALPFPEGLVEAIAERAAQIVVERLRAEHQRWPEWMSVESAAMYLDVSPERVRKLQANGLLPFHQEGPGCRVFFRRAELDEAMAERPQRP
jgi:excisionase family DNA binding protein